MTRPKPLQDHATLHQRRLAKDIAFSRALVIAALVLLVVVVIADALYIAYVPRRGGHLILPALVFAAPVATVFFLVVTMWNWRVIRRRLVSMPNEHTAGERSH